jgi:glycosyltransferase 2 family protein
MKGWVSRLVAGIVAGVAIYVGFSIWADVGRVGEALRAFRWRYALFACLLAAGNYAVRFLRWHYYLRVVGAAEKVSLRDSAQVFLAGFALTVTPGKLGEAVKAVLLRASHGIPMARTAPIVIAERVTDLLALLLLALVGVFSFDVDRRFLIAGAVMVVGGVLVVAIDPLAKRAIRIVGRLPVVRRVAHRLEEFHSHTAILLAPTPLVLATVLAVASWFLECLAFNVVVHGFPGASVSLRAATFIYAAMTVAGALSFLPGGLGVTEAGMLALLVRFGTGIDRGTAAAATFVTRAATLWFAVALGLPALLRYARRKHVEVDIDVARGPQGKGLP